MSLPRILIAEGSMVLRAAIADQLSSEEYELLEAANGDAAYARARADAPDVVLLDVDVPGMDAHDVLEAMQADAALAHIPVVLLSERVSADDVVRGLELGAHDFLRKPPEAGELIARVAAAMKTKVLQDQLRADDDVLRETAPMDSLTGALDIVGLQQRLRELTDESRRSGSPLGAVLLDIDGLADVNARFGRDGGDEVLRELARRVMARLVPAHVVGRCGPDELLVLLPGVGAHEARMLAVDLRVAVSTRPYAIAGEDVPVDVSVGASANVGMAEQLLVELQDAIVTDKASRPRRGFVVDDTVPVAPLAPVETLPLLPELPNLDVAPPQPERFVPIELPDHMVSAPPKDETPVPEPARDFGALMVSVEQLLVDDPGAIRALVHDLRPRDDHRARGRRRFFSQKH